MAGIVLDDAPTLESFEKAVKGFERQVQREGIIAELRAKSFAQTRSQKKRAKSFRAVKRSRKLARIRRKNESGRLPLCEVFSLKYGSYDFEKIQTRSGRIITIPVPLIFTERQKISILPIRTQGKKRFSDKTVLMIQRDTAGRYVLVLDAEKHGRWGFPTGSVGTEKDPNEKVEDAAMRENPEETGFMIDRPQLPNDCIGEIKKGRNSLVLLEVFPVGGKMKTKQDLEKEGENREILDIGLFSPQEIEEMFERDLILYGHHAAFKRHQEVSG